MTSLYKPVKYVIFDLDGTLIDTERLNAECYQTVLSKRGKTFTNDMRFKVMGRTSKDVYRIFSEAYKIPISELASEIEEETCKSMTNVTVMPGAEELVTHLYEHRVPMAIATSSTAEAIKVKTKNLRHIFDLFCHITSGSSDPEVRMGKPAPDIFLVCASRFPDKPLPCECLVIEDAPTGVRAATDAGMQVVMVPDPIVPKEMETLATKVIPSLLEFKPEEFGLPRWK